MRGTATNRTILVWICILSLAFSGCATNRSSVPPAGSRPEPFHALAVVPSERIPDINVVRMGSSRVLGALQGAGRGFVEGVAAVASGAGGLHGTGSEGDVAVIAVFVAVMLSVGTVNALIEGVKGARVPAPYETVSDPGDATRKRIASLGIQNGFARLVEEEFRERHSVPVSFGEPPEENGGVGTQYLRDLKDAGVDAALRVEIARVGFEGRVGKDMPLALAITLRAEIVRTADGTTVFTKTTDYRSEAVPPEEWVKDDFLRILREVDDGVHFLATRCVDDIVDAGLVSVP